MDLSKRAEPQHRETRRYHLGEVEVRRADDGTAQFRGVASAFEKPYTVYDAFGEFTETVRAGAADKTLSEKPDVVFLVNHEGLTMARTTAGTLKLAAKKDGLHVEADLDANRHDVHDVVSALDRGDVDEMSFAFRVTRQEWNEDYTERWINEFNIHRGDVSAVNFGANPHTTAALRSFGCGVEEFEDAFRAVREGTADPGQRALVERVAVHLNESLTPVADTGHYERLLTFNKNRLLLAG